MGLTVPDEKVALDVRQIEELLAAEFPQLNRDARTFAVEAVGPGWARMRLIVRDVHLRQGGTVSGPAIFALADVCLYVAILARIGPVLQTVTTSLNLNFLRRPPPRDLLAECRLLKVGRRLAVGEVTVRCEDAADPVAHATGTYSIPSRYPDTASRKPL